jgi:hypothetical protein
VFNKGDKVKLIGTRKGEVLSTTEHGQVEVQIGNIVWFFSSDEARKTLEVIEPKHGSVVIDRDGAPFVRGDGGWYYAVNSASGPGSYSWTWKDLNEACGPLAVAYHYVNTRVL